MILYLKVVKGRGGYRWRWYLEDEDGKKICMCTGSFLRKQAGGVACGKLDGVRQHNRGQRPQGRTEQEALVFVAVPMKFLKDMMKAEDRAITILHLLAIVGIVMFGTALADLHGVGMKTDKKLLAGFLLVPAIYIVGAAIALAVFG